MTFFKNPVAVIAVCAFYRTVPRSETVGWLATWDAVIMVGSLVIGMVALVQYFWAE